MECICGFIQIDRQKYRKTGENTQGGVWAMEDIALFRPIGTVISQMNVKMQLHFRVTGSHCQLDRIDNRPSWRDVLGNESCFLVLGS